MYIGRTSPACLKPDRMNQPRRKSTLNLDQVLNDIEACLKYLEQGEPSLFQLRKLLAILPSLRSSESVLKSTTQSISTITSVLNEFEKQQNPIFSNKLKSPHNYHGIKSASYFLQRNISHLNSEVIAMKGQIHEMLNSKDQMIKSKGKEEEKENLKEQLQDKRMKFIEKLNKQIMHTRKRMDDIRLMDQCSMQMKQKIHNLQEYKDIEEKHKNYRSAIGMIKCMNHWIKDKKMKVQVKEKLQKSQSLKPSLKSSLKSSNKNNGSNQKTNFIKLSPKIQKQRLYNIEKQEKLKQINLSLQNNEIQFQKWKERIETRMKKIKQRKSMNIADVKKAFCIEYESFENLSYRVEGLKKFYQTQIDKISENENLNKNKKPNRAIYADIQLKKTEQKIEEKLFDWNNLRNITSKSFQRN